MIFLSLNRTEWMLQPQGWGKTAAACATETRQIFIESIQSCCFGTDADVCNTITCSATCSKCMCCHYNGIDRSNNCPQLFVSQQKLFLIGWEHWQSWTHNMGERSKGACWVEAYLDAMKGVMSNSRGKETYVVIFRRSLAECSNRWGMARAGGEGEERREGGEE